MKHAYSFIILFLSLSSFSQSFNRPLYIDANAREAAVLEAYGNTFVAISESTDDSIYYTVMYKLDQVGNILALDTLHGENAIGPQAKLGNTFYTDMIMLPDSTFILFGQYFENCGGSGAIGGFAVNYDSNLNRLYENSFQDYGSQNYDFVVLDSGGYAMHGTNSTIKLAYDLTVVQHYIESTLANDLETIHLPGDWFYYMGGYVPVTDTSFIRNIHTGSALGAPRLEGYYLDITDTTFIFGGNNNRLILYDKRNFQKLDSINPYNVLGFGYHWSTISYRSEELIIKEYQGKKFAVLSKSDLSVIGIDSIQSDGLYLNFRGGMCYYDSTLVFASAMDNGQINVESFKLNKPKAPGFESPTIKSTPFNFNLISKDVSKDSTGIQTMHVKAFSEWKVAVINNSNETITNAAFSYKYDQQGVVCQGLRSSVELDSLNILPGDTLQFTLGPLDHSSDVLLPGNFHYFMHIAPIMINHNIIASDSLYLGFGVLKDISLHETKPLTNCFKIFPNPAKDRLTLDFEGSFEGELSIIDSSGKLFMEQKVNLPIGGQFDLNIQPLPNGMYIFKLSDGNQSKSERLIIH